MCGLAALIDPSGAPVDRDVVERMTRAVAPRGPDGEGFWFGPGVGLGHRRLKVIDPSDAGAQPMGSPDGQVQLVFNGEIYNFMDLRAELCGLGHAFTSHSDTEVLLTAYLQWGEAALDRLDGMFAFVVWDGRQRRVFAARDRMGKKPLYCARVRRSGGLPPLLAFASELKALLPVPGFDRTLSPAALGRYLSFEYVPPPLTIFEGARKLDASECLTVDLAHDLGHAPQPRRYWDLPFPARHDFMSGQDAASNLWSLLRRAVERRLVADVPLGVFLSGGLDSSAVAAAMHDLLGSGARISTFSIGFSDPSYDESAHARKVARHLGTRHHEEIVEAKTMLDVLPQITRLLDEPLADASIVPTYLLSRFARQHVAVALGGDGGDELFAGYPTFKADRWAKAYFRFVPKRVQGLVSAGARRLPASTQYFSLDFKLNQFLRGGDLPGPRRHQRWMASFLPEELSALLTPEMRAHADEDPLALIDGRAGVSSARHEHDRLMDHYARFYLSGDVNVKVDRASSAVGLEVRAPFLDTALVRFACQIPPQLRQRGGVSKYVLKRALRGRLPPEIIDRKKQGFGVPVARWMKEDLQPMLRDELAPEKLKRQGVFRPDLVQRLIEDHVSGRRDRRKVLWTLLTFERWWGLYGRGEALSF